MTRPLGPFRCMSEGTKEDRGLGRLTPSRMGAKSAMPRDLPGRAVTEAARARAAAGCDGGGGMDAAAETATVEERDAAGAATSAPGVARSTGAAELVCSASTCEGAVTPVASLRVIQTRSCCEASFGRLTGISNMAPSGAATSSPFCSSVFCPPGNLSPVPFIDRSRTRKGVEACLVSHPFLTLTSAWNTDTPDDMTRTSFCGERPILRTVSSSTPVGAPVPFSGRSTNCSS
mmetsp:Transcript_23650/g.62307  ORF Transcript_23650/g.62307 Transcript_23650/m.62307 type:complete len:232 (-) Transcript_23650:410-1105(-)